MADVRDSQLPLTTDVVGLQIPVLLPDGVSSTGYENYRIPIANFQASLQTQIISNTNAISLLSSRTTVLENGLTKVSYSAQSGSFQYSQPENSDISGIYMRRNGWAVPRTAVGFTLYDGGGTNGEEILTERTHDLDGNYFRKIESVPDSYNEVGAGSRTIYFQAISGIVDVVIYLKTNLFT